MEPVGLNRFCRSCRVSWRGDLTCWSCGRRCPEPAERVVIANAAGPNTSHVGVPLNL